MLKHFEIELGWIKNATIREFTKFCLEKAPTYFWTNPSSSTGKYHSTWSNGEGGLVRHTKATAFVAKELGDCYGLSADEKDAAISAAILHDICKYGLPGSKHTTKTHDLDAAKFIHKLAGTFDKEVPLLMVICGGVAWHFGKWSTRATGAKQKKFPEEYSKVEHLVHIADMVASRKGISFDFISDQSFVG